MLRAGIFLFLFFLSSFASASECWKHVQMGQHDQELACALQEWNADTDVQDLNRLLDALFYVYVSKTDNNDVKKFYDGLRGGRYQYAKALEMKSRLLSKYTFDEQVVESAATWSMSPVDARRLFVLTQVDPQSVPYPISVSMQLAVYDEVDRYFNLNSAQQGQTGTLPASEYIRLLVVLQRMASASDEFLYAVNRYHQGLVWTHLHRSREAAADLDEAVRVLRSLSSTAREPVSRKRILHALAPAATLRGNYLEAEQSYFSLLRMDPNDWSALLELSYLLNRRGECSERSVWIEASLLPKHDLFDIVIHCGSHEIPDPEYPTEPPAIARQLHPSAQAACAG
jgi:tetratricopeptide (TPR) repeat protein